MVLFSWLQLNLVLGSLRHAHLKSETIIFDDPMLGVNYSYNFGRSLHVDVAVNPLVHWRAGRQLRITL